MDKVQAVTALFSTLSLLALAFMYFHLYRRLRVDWFRQDIFDLRHELFLYARSGKIRFDHPAYRMLRSTMNGYLRFGHRMTLLQTVFMSIFDRSQQKSRNLYDMRWNQACTGLSDDVRYDLDHMRTRMQTASETQVLLVSPLISVLVLVSLAVAVGIATVILAIRRRPNFRFMSSFRTLLRLDNFDEAAYLIGTDPRSPIAHA